MKTNTNGEKGGPLIRVEPHAKKNEEMATLNWLICRGLLSFLKYLRATETIYCKCKRQFFQGVRSSPKEEKKAKSKVRDQTRRVTFKSEFLPILHISQQYKDRSMNLRIERSMMPQT